MATWIGGEEGVLIQGDDDEVPEFLADIVAHLLTTIFEELCQGDDGEEIDWQSRYSGG